MKRWLVVAALAACEGIGDPGPDAYVGTNPGDLGMNDVSMLIPLPATTATPTLLKMTDGGDLVPRTLFDRVVTQPGDVISTYDEFHLVAVRFDLCDRTQAGPCPAGADGRLRLVFQPLLAGTSQVEANDVALHAFYPIPSAELPAVVDQLRALAAIGGTPLTAPLAVGTSAFAKPAYTQMLRELVLRYAAAPKLVRLTLFAQNAMAAALIWAFRGAEVSGGTVTDMIIPSVQVKQQRATLVGISSYDVVPAADAPQGMMRAFDRNAFQQAATADRQQALGALADSLNPLVHGADTEQCVNCHVATFLLADRSSLAGGGPSNVYATNHDVSISAGKSVTTDRSLRAFGWLFEEPMISQRVANDTAQVLVEIEQRFPAP